MRARYGGISTHKPLCTLTFGEPVQPAMLNDAARGCLNRAAAEFQPGRNDAQPVLDRTFTVQVTAESLWHHLRDLWHDDPIKVVKYFLPGGQGWSGIGAFLTGLIALLTSLGIIAWIKRKIDARGNPTKGSSDSP